MLACPQRTSGHGHGSVHVDDHDDDHDHVAPGEAWTRRNDGAFATVKPC